MKNVLSFASRIGLIFLGFFLGLFNLLLIATPRELTEILENPSANPAQILMILPTFVFGIGLGLWFVFGLAVKMVGLKKSSYVIGAGMLISISLPLLMATMLNREIGEPDLFWYLVSTIMFGMQFAFCIGCFMMALDLKRLTFEKRAE